jgi:hypothetical protein
MGRKGRKERSSGHVMRAVRCVPRNPRIYRYLLEIRLLETPGPCLAVVLKNPSTASEKRSDPTIGKIEAWAKRREFASVAVVNLFAFRSPYPAELARRPYRRIVGPANDRYILATAQGADLVVAGWGEPNGIDPVLYDRRAGEVMRLLQSVQVHQVGNLTRAGYPRHGLVWNGPVESQPFRFKPDFGKSGVSPRAS